MIAEERLESRIAGDFELEMASSKRFTFWGASIPSKWRIFLLTRIQGTFSSKWALVVL